jgi:hypothetical protein
MVGDLSYVEIVLEEREKALDLLQQVHEDPRDPTGVMLEKAQLGDVADAEQYLAASHPEKDRETMRVFRDLPILRATVSMAKHKPAEAIQQLEPARPYQLCDFQVPYLRAAADYRLILANQGVDPVSPLYSLAHLRLARVLVKQDQRGPAEAEYRAFLDAWREAAEDEPLKKQAREELQGVVSRR